MFKIAKKRILNPQTKLFEVEAPRVAKKAEPGQFVILRVDENGERIPLTVAGFDRAAGTVTIIFQEVGVTTMKLGALEEGEYIADFVGPLGTPSHLEGLKSVCIVGGGLGCAIAYPQAKRLRELGARVDVIIGFRTKELIMLEEEFAAAANRLIVCTDDGSNGRKALVTNELQKLLDEGGTYDAVITVGPLVMMKYVARTTKPYGIKTVVSMNPIMIDGTGMCGVCRVTVGGETKFACVDGPEFDGHEIDFDEAIRRSGMYRKYEVQAAHRHACRLTGEKKTKKTKRSVYRYGESVAKKSAHAGTGTPDEK